MNKKITALKWFFNNYIIILIVFLVFFPKVSYEIAKYYDNLYILFIGILICLFSMYLFFKYDMKPFYTRLCKQDSIIRFNNKKIHNLFFNK